jgi:hypothetical protein
MKNKLDELFKNKTEGYQKEPSADAWNKIHQNLHPKSKMPYWQIAASIILILGVSMLLYFQLSNHDKQQPAVANNDKSDSAQVTKSPIIEKNIAQENEIINEEQKIIDTPTTEKINNRNLLANKGNISKEINEQVEDKIKIKVPEMIENKEALATVIEEPVNPIIEPQPDAEVVQAPSSTRKKLPPVTIVYKKSTENTENVAKNKSNNSQEGLGKILTIAKEIKNGDLKISELRDVKDELLALEINIKRNNVKSRD